MVTRRDIISLGTIHNPHDTKGLIGTTTKPLHHNPSNFGLTMFNCHTSALQASRHRNQITASASGLLRSRDGGSNIASLLRRKDQISFSTMTK